MGRSAYVARAGSKSQSAPGEGVPVLRSGGSLGVGFPRLPSKRNQWRWTADIRCSAVPGRHR